MALMRTFARPCEPCLPATSSARSSPFFFIGRLLEPAEPTVEEPLLPAVEPPVPTVEDQPILPLPAAEPPVPTVLLVEPLPAVEPPTPTVEDVPALPLPAAEP